jgi:hypothetical protein
LTRDFLRTCIDRGAGSDLEKNDEQGRGGWEKKKRKAKDKEKETSVGQRKKPE